MIVTRAKAEEAANILAVAYDAVDNKQVHRAYIAAAKVAHPDKGGTAEAFARVDWARAVLLAWLARDGLDGPITGNACGVCGGTGRAKMQKGFRTYYMICGTCRGTGDGGYDHDFTGDD